MLPADPLRLTLLAVPLFLAGAAAGALRGLSIRAPEGSRRRRTLSAAWVLVLLALVPVLLILAAVLQLW